MRVAQPRSMFTLVLLPTDVVLAGCSGQTDSSPSSTATATATPSPTDTESSGPASNDPDVAASSEFIRVNPGEAAQMQYRGETITVSYTTSSGTTQIDIEVRKSSETFTREMSSTGESVSRSIENLQVTLKPVKTVDRDGQTVYVLDETWDASYVEVAIFCKTDC